MAKWDFKIVGASFVKELVPIADDVQPRSQSFMQPSFHLEGGKIVIKESGQYVTAIYFSQIGEIDGVAPTDIDDAYAKLLTLVENFNGGEGTPQNLAQTLAIDNKTNDIPIVSNNGNGYAYVNDEQTVIGNDFGGTKKITMNEDSFAIETNVRATIDGKGLNLNTTTDGFGLPRLTTTQMNAIAFPTEGMLVRNTTESKIYQFNGTVWEPLSNPPQTLAETLAVDNKTNDIPLVSNNGNAVVYVNDNYLLLEHGNNALTLEPTTDGLQLYSDIQVYTAAPEMTAIIDNVISYACPSFLLNSEEVATQPYADAKVANDLTASTTVAPSKTAVLTEYDMITGLTFSGAFALDKKGGRSYLPYTQTGSLTLSIGGSPIIGSFAVLRFTADGSAISGYSGWKLLSSDDITATNGVVHRVIVYQYEDEIWYSVKLN